MGFAEGTYIARASVRKSYQLNPKKKQAFEAQVGCKVSGLILGSRFRARGFSGFASCGLGLVGFLRKS